MSELEAAVEFSVELSKFYNIDLFQRGFYQIRTSLKYPAKLPIKHEVSLPRNSDCDLVFPACIANGVAISKTFQILYRNEDITINDMILFKVSMLVDSQKIEECIEKADLQLCVELFFDEDYVPDQQERLQCVSQRLLKLNFTPTKGLHHHVPVMFDYFHLSTVSLTVHGTLVMLQQPYINPKYPKDSWPNKTADKATLETVYFGLIKPVAGSTRRLHQAQRIHCNICSILLSSYESLQASLTNFMSKLPHQQQINIESHDCHAKLKKVEQKIQCVSSEDDFVPTATADIATLCAENLILWMQFIEAVTFNETITKYLAEEHHVHRVKRFAEGFFTADSCKSKLLECYEPSIHGHSDYAAIVKNSPYYQSIPPLHVECLEMDGDYTLLPIIFEDVFTDQVNVITFDGSDCRKKLGATRSDHSNADSASTHSSTSSTGDGMSPKMRHRQRKFIKNIKPGTFKRPGSMYALDEAEAHNFEEPKSGVSLIGYSKKSSSAVVQIGTLSPKIGRDPGLGTPGTFRKLSDNVPAPLISCGSDVAVSETKMSAAISVPCLNHEQLLTSVTLGTGVETTQQNSQGDVRKAWGTAGPRTRHDWAGSVVSTTTVSENKLTSFERSTSHSQKFSIDEDFRRLNGVTLEELNTMESDRADNNDIIIEDITEEPLDEGDNARVAGMLQLQKQDYDTLATSISKALGEPDELSIGEGDEPVSVVERAGVRNCESDSEVVVTTGVGTSDAIGVDVTCLSKPAYASSASSGGHLFTAREFFKEEYDSMCKSKNSPLNSQTGHSVAHVPPRNVMQNGGHHLIHGPSCPVLTDTSDVSFTRFNQPIVHQPLLRHGLEQGLHSSSSLPELTSLEKKNSSPANRLVAAVADQTINFITAKELMKAQLHFNGHLYSDFMTQNSSIPYFWPPEKRLDDGLHLIICVHGLDGNSADLRLVRTFVELCLPGERVDFLMSERNQIDTFTDFDTMTDRLVSEILYYLEMFSVTPARVSFIGHSLGNVIIRSALSRPELSPLVPKLYTFLSLSGPHLGTLYNSSGLVNMGMWVMQKLKKSGSLLQLSLKDSLEPRDSFLYQLSKKPGLQYFKHVLLVGSSQDRYVPFHSSRIEICKSAARDTTIYGNIYCEMVKNLLEPVIARPDITVVRYDVFHALPNTANSLIGRAAHIAVLDSEIFLEKFISVAALKYFK